MHETVSPKICTCAQFGYTGDHKCVRYGTLLGYLTETMLFCTSLEIIVF